jgi:hypothetical protein
MAKEDALEKVINDALVERRFESNSTGLVKVTTYIREDQALALEMLENAERQRRGGNFDQSELFQEALDMLIKASFVAIRLKKDRPLRIETDKE